MKTCAGRWSFIDIYYSVPFRAPRNIAVSMSHFWARAPEVTYNWCYSKNSHIEPTGHSIHIAGIFLFLGLECCRARWELSNNPKFRGGEPTFLRNLASNLKFWPQISPPPRGLGAQFCYHAMRDVKASLSSKPYDAGTLPEFLANFFQIFGFFSVEKVQGLISRNCQSLLRSNFADWQNGHSACDSGKKFGGQGLFLTCLAPLKWPIILANFGLYSIINSGSTL